MISRSLIPVRQSTASRKALLGIVPVLTDVPPTAGSFSMTAVFRPALVAWIAAAMAGGTGPHYHNVVNGHAYS